jgi:N-acetylmuramic acid 6-phosphate etherase
VSEGTHPRADEIDGLDTLELLQLMHAEDRSAVAAVTAQLAAIAVAVDAVAARLQAGGRLHYFGAGTSGRLGALDAAECPPTFGVDASVVQAHDAGDGEAEDDGRRGCEEARAHVEQRDAVVAISASGKTAYAIGAVEEARRAGALVVGLSCATGTPLGAASDVAIEIETGPEVIAGSTRLKAGTVQKVVLNMISTGVFTRLGRTYRGRMVGVAPANTKLAARAQALVSDLTGADRAGAERALADSGGSAAVAVLMLRGGLTAGEARARLEAARGDLAAALGERTGP